MAGKAAAPRRVGWGDLGPNAHVCVPHEGAGARWEAVVPFVRRGLEQRELCLYVAEDGAQSEVLSVLEGAGIGPKGARDAASLVVVGKADAYLREGRFDPDRTLTWIRARAEAATRSGFTALRVVGEMNGVSGPYPGVERLQEYEARLTQVLADRPISALCTYDRARFAPSVLREAIATHPLVAVRSTVHRNSFHVPPDDYLAVDRPRGEVQRILEALGRLPPEEEPTGERERIERGVSRGLFAAQEAERRSLARDLHDDLAQVLAAVHLSLERARMEAGSQAAAALADSDALVNEAAEYVRGLALDLRPSLLDDVGLGAALRSLGRRQSQRGAFELDADLRALEEARVSPALATTAFRVVQEALTNVARHASARHVALVVRTRGEDLEIVVRDDGSGFDVATMQRSWADGGRLGLVGMAERIALADGTLTLESAPGRGTTLRARMALARPSPR